MGFSYAHNIAKAGAHLLGILKAQGEVRYSAFFDGSEETHEALALALEVDADGFDSPAGLMDLAAYELEEQGIVSIQKLSDKLADDEPDYRITLTESGRTLLAQGETPRYWDAE